ncbi:MAG: MFS transporter [Candidatus Geothermincolia bacterium]
MAGNDSPVEAVEAGLGGPDEKKAKLGRTVKTLGFVSLLTDMSSEMIYPLLPVFLTSVLGASVIFLGVIEGVAEGTASILKGFSGYISDRLEKRKALILAGYGLSALTKPFFAAADAVWQVLVVRFVDRIGKGLRTAPRDALIAETTDPAIRGKAYGFHRGMDTLGAVIGPAIAFLMMWLLQGQGNSAYRWVFLAAFIPGLAAVILIVFAIKETPFSAKAKFPSLKLSGFSRHYKMLLVVVAVFTLGNSSDAFLLLRAQNLGMKPYLIPVVWMVFNLVYSLLSTPGGMLSDRIGRKKTLLLGFPLYALVYLGFGFAHRLVYVWLLFAAYGVFYGLTQGCLSAYVADLAPPEMKGTAFGVYHMTDGVFKLLASVIFGVIWASSATSGPMAAFLFGGTMALISAVLLWRFCDNCTDAT